jgi:hypothetical protein
LTLDELRQRLWWIGADPGRSHIVALENNRVTIEIIQHTWNGRTERYERSVEEALAAVGFRVEWRRGWSSARRRNLADARTNAAHRGESFDEEAFVAARCVEERERLEHEAREADQGQD